MQQNLQRTINELVSENHVRASILYYFGVKFYDYEAKTLAEVCNKHGLNVESVTKALELVDDGSQQTVRQLKSLPIELLVEYLKHSHFLFVKKRLPYIGQLIDGLGNVNFRYKALANDLKSVFPLFVEDFVHHIYEEEDTLFTYISRLQNFIRSQKPVSSVLYFMKKCSVSDFALDHEVHENEMEGFRQFTNGYKYCEEADLHIKVLYSELERFEDDLLKHARIEDEILFPKAMQLEREVKLRFHELSKLN